MRHLIDPTDLTVRETEQIVALAEDIIANRAKYSEACRGKKLATLFYEPSTRTRLSFTPIRCVPRAGNTDGAMKAEQCGYPRSQSLRRGGDLGAGPVCKHGGRP